MSYIHINCKVSIEKDINILPNISNKDSPQRLIVIKM